MEEALGRALREWRDKKAFDWLGPEHADLHGGHAVITDNVLADIVKYASKGKLTTVEGLRVDARWSLAPQFGTEVLSIVKDHFPPPTQIPSKRRVGNLGRGSQSVLADSTGIFINLSEHSVSSCCKVDCMIFVDDRRLNWCLPTMRGDHAISLRFLLILIDIVSVQPSHRAQWVPCKRTSYDCQQRLFLNSSGFFLAPPFDQEEI